MDAPVEIEGFEIEAFTPEAARLATAHLIFFDHDVDEIPAMLEAAGFPPKIAATGYNAALFEIIPAAMHAQAWRAVKRGLLWLVGCLFYGGIWVVLVTQARGIDPLVLFLSGAIGAVTGFLGLKALHEAWSVYRERRTWTAEAQSVVRGGGDVRNG